MRRLLAYCVVTFTISWGGIFLLVRSGVSLDEEHLPVLLGVGYVAMLAGPSLAATLLTAVLDGRAGLGLMRNALLRWRVGARWWLSALFVAPLSIGVVLVALSLLSPLYVPRLLVEADRGALLGFVAISSLLTGVFEELGWTGFAVPALLGRHGVVRTGVAIGLVAGLWNLPIVYLKELSLPTPGPLPLPLFLVVCLVTWQVAYRVLLVYAYDRTRSVLLAMAMQTSLVAAWTSFTPLGLTQPTLMLFYLVLTGVWCVVAAVILGDRRTRSLRRGGDSRELGKLAVLR